MLRLGYVALILLLLSAIVHIPMVGRTPALHPLALTSVIILLYLASALNLAINKRIVMGGRPGAVLKVLGISTALAATSLILETLMIAVYEYSTVLVTSFPGIAAVLVLAYSMYLVTRVRSVPGAKR